MNLFQFLLKTVSMQRKPYQVITDLRLLLGIDEYMWSQHLYACVHSYFLPGCLLLKFLQTLKAVPSYCANFDTPASCS